MSSTTTTLRRPTSVTIIGVLMLVSAVLQVVVGVWMLVAASRGESYADTAIEDWSDGRLRGSAVGTFVLAALYAVLALGVLRGIRLARIIITVVAVIAIIAGVFTWPVGIGPVLLNVLILVMLWHRTADDFFKAPAPG